ncbi:MAG TPA: DUF3131 domain-containing protein [Gemmatimonadaceae bacterium]
MLPTRSRAARVALASALALLASGCGGDDGHAALAASDSGHAGGPAGAAVVTPAGNAPVATPSEEAAWLTPARRAEEDSIYRDAAGAAWRFADRNYLPATGLTRPFDHYAIGTMWDVASGLAATFSAAELELLPREQAVQRLSTAIGTLERLPLFDATAFNKEYVFTSGAPIDVNRRPARTGYGISATDTGRLLLWLRIVATRYPALRPRVEAVVRRLDLEGMVDDGYLRGRQLSLRTGRVRKFQEGRIGYEQYAARGFTAWQVPASAAADITRNMEGETVLGVEVPKDRRGGDRLTSEPFVLLGMEAGWNGAESVVARKLLAVQAARYARTGTLTMVSEDAIDLAPHYFYFYTILSRRGPFTVEVQRQVPVNGPRWVSTKAAFAWHALLPGEYTRRVVDLVRTSALGGGVWGAGVLENGRATGNPNLNTAAVVLEAAAYRRVGRPFLTLPPIGS